MMASFTSLQNHFRFPVDHFNHPAYPTGFAFSALTLLVGPLEGHPACKKTPRVVGCWCGCLSGARCRFAYGPADAIATHCLVSVKSWLVLPFKYRLTWVVQEKGPLNGCVCVCYPIGQGCISVCLWCWCTVVKCLTRSSWYWCDSYHRGELVCIHWLHITHEKGNLSWMLGAGLQISKCKIYLSSISIKKLVTTSDTIQTCQQHVSTSRCSSSVSQSRRPYLDTAPSASPLSSATSCPPPISQSPLHGAVDVQQS